ncbi:MAG: flagellar hook-basal body complex protein FliE [Hyphomonas sp.]|jgi:flagellar hook-basal body complex protein FliE|nr:flagellar hook-basal body complex protein FliE [Hyphomonas sp.]
MSTVGFSAYAALGSVKPTQVSEKPAQDKVEKPGLAEGFSTFKAALQEAEQAAMQTAVSGADPHAMVEALAQAELVLDAAVTVRDKVVEAYQELLRMPV